MPFTYTMTNREKAERIKPWINPEERVTVDFQDVQGLNVEVMGCTEHVVHLILQKPFPHMKERITVPLRMVEVEEDPYHYTRDPDSPIQNRLRLRVDLQGPPWLQEGSVKNV